MAQSVEAGIAEDTPKQLKSSPALRALYNNLQKDLGKSSRAGRVLEGDPVVDLAMELDAEVKRVKPDGWRGVQAREQVIKAALFEILNDKAEVERMFLIIKAQDEY